MYLPMAGLSKKTLLVHEEGTVQKETLWGKRKKILFFEEIFCILGEKRGFQLSGLLGLLLAYMCFGFFSHIVWKSFYKRRGGGKKGSLIVKTKDSPFSSRIQLFASFL